MVSTRSGAGKSRSPEISAAVGRRTSAISPDGHDAVGESSSGEPKGRVDLKDEELGDAGKEELVIHVEDSVEGADGTGSEWEEEGSSSGVEKDEGDSDEKWVGGEAKPDVGDGDVELVVENGNDAEDSDDGGGESEDEGSLSEAEDDKGADGECTAEGSENNLEGDEEQNLSAGGADGEEEKEVDPAIEVDVVEKGDAYPLESFLLKSVTKPHLFMSRSLSVTSACRTLMKHVYDGQSSFEDSVSKVPDSSSGTSRRRRKRARSQATLGPLPHIEIGDVFETDQVWEELVLRNRPMSSFLERSILKEEKADAKKLELKEAAADEGEGVDVVDGGNGEAEGSFGNEETGEFVGAKDGKPANQAIAFDGSDSEEMPDNVPEGLAVSPSEPVQKKVRFIVDAGGTDDAHIGGDKTGPSNVEDGFFNFADMEAFGDEAEELALDGKLMADDEEDNSGSDNDDDEVALEGDSMTLGGKLKGGSQRTGDRVRYDDFFDRPGFEGSDKTALDPEAERALRRATMFDTGDSTSSDGEKEGPKTTLQLEREKLKDSISALEHANVSKKPWQLRGEVDARGRPLNSLIESEFEHDIVARPRGALSADASASIEDIIRQRIFDGLFDDVVRKLPADYESAKNKNKREPPPEISQARPEEGLADIYEREFAEEREKVSKASEAASSITVREAEPGESPEQAEINKLFKRLSNKLDSLTGLHFTPSLPKIPAEMEVKLNVPALNAEEAIPEAVSDATLLAAREVHAPDMKDLQGDVETDKLERRKNRRSKKRKISGANKEKEAAEKEALMGDPDRAVHLRAQRTLQRPGKLLQTVKTPGYKSKKKNRQTNDQNIDGLGGKSGDFSKSTRFFSQLQETTRKDLAGKNSDLAATASAGKSAGELKL